MAEGASEPSVDSATVDFGAIRVGEYGDPLCPLPGCNAELRLTVHADYVLKVIDDVPRKEHESANTEVWEVGCTEGHIVLNAKNFDGDSVYFDHDIEYGDDGEEIPIDDGLRLKELYR